MHLYQPFQRIAPTQTSRCCQHATRQPQTYLGLNLSAPRLQNGSSKRIVFPFTRSVYPNGHAGAFYPQAQGSSTIFPQLPVSCVSKASCTFRFQSSPALKHRCTSTYSQNKGHIQPFSEVINTYIITHSLMQVSGSLSRNYFTSDPRNKQDMTVIQTRRK